MYAVLAYPASQHDRKRSRPRRLFPRRFAIHALGHDAAGAAEYQGLTPVAFVEGEGAGGHGYARLVASVHYAPMHAFQYVARVDKAGRQLSLGRVRIAEAEHVGVKDGFSAHTRAQDVAVDAHDTGNGAAVGIQRRGAVMGLSLDAEHRTFEELHYARVVHEYRAQEGLARRQILGGLAYIALV